MAQSADADLKTRLQNWIPKLVLSPSLAVILVFVYGFILFSVYLSFTDSRLLPTYGWVGLENYSKLWRLSHWEISLTNMGIFALLYITDLHRNRPDAGDLSGSENPWRRLVAPPLSLPDGALSFIVTGTAWKWFLDPGIGLENVVQSWGWESFEFDWIKNRDFAIYTVVIAAVWQTSGFVMAMFLAGLRGIDNEILKAAQMDGASNWNLYRRIIIPAAAARVPVGFRDPQPPCDQDL